MIGAIRRSRSRAFARKKGSSRCGIVWGLLMRRELTLLTMRKQRTCIICAGLVESRGSAIDFLICAVARREWHILQLTATSSGIGECWGLGCLRLREAKIGDTSGARADKN